MPRARRARRGRRSRRSASGSLTLGEGRGRRTAEGGTGRAHVSRLKCTQHSAHSIYLFLISSCWSLGALCTATLSRIGFTLSLTNVLSSILENSTQKRIPYYASRKPTLKSPHSAAALAPDAPMHPPEILCLLRTTASANAARARIWPRTPCRRCQGMRCPSWRTRCRPRAMCPSSRRRSCPAGSSASRNSARTTRRSRSR